MRLLFKVMGSPKWGMGHVIRSIELAREITDSRGAIVEFACNPDPSSLDKIESAGFTVHPNLEVGEALAGWIAGQSIDVLLFDQPINVRDLSSMVRKVVPHVWMTALDHFDLEGTLLDCVFNLIHQGAVDRGIPPKSLAYFEGLEYGIIRSFFDPYMALSRARAKKIPTVLVMFGGSDPNGITHRILRFLQGGLHNEIRFRIIVGPNVQAKEELRETIAGMNGRVEFHVDPSPLAKLMFECDLAVCGGASTLLELAALGTPTLFVAQTPEEQRFAERFQSEGAVLSLGGFEHLKPEPFLKALREVLGNPEQRAVMSEASRILVDGGGRSRVARTIAERGESGHATK